MIPTNILSVKTIIIYTILCSFYNQHASAEGQLGLLNASIIDCQTSVGNLQILLLNTSITTDNPTSPSTTTTTTPTTNSSTSTSTTTTTPSTTDSSTSTSTTTTTPSTTDSSTTTTTPSTTDSSTSTSTTTTTPSTTDSSTSTSTTTTTPSTTDSSTTTTTPSTTDSSTSTSTITTTPSTTDSSTSTSTTTTTPSTPDSSTSTSTTTTTRSTTDSSASTSTTTTTPSTTDSSTSALTITTFPSTTDSSTNTMPPTTIIPEETTVPPSDDDIESILSADNQTRWGNQVNLVLESMDIILWNITENPYEVNSSDLDSKNSLLNKLISRGEKFNVLVIRSDVELLMNSSNATLQFADEALTVVENATSMTTIVTTFETTPVTTLESSSTTTGRSRTTTTPESGTRTTPESNTTTLETTTEPPPDSSTVLIIWLVSALLLCIIISIILVVWKPWKRRSPQRTISMPPQQQMQVFPNQEAAGVRNRGFVRDIDEPQITTINIPRPVTIPMSTRNVQSSASYDRYAPQKPEPKMAPLPRSYKTYT